MSKYQWTNEPTSTLASGIVATSTSFTVATGGGAAFPATGPFIVKIDNEFIQVATRSGDVFSGLTRGVETSLGGGTAATHSTGATVAQPITAGQAQAWHQTGVAELTQADMAAANIDGTTTTPSLRTLGTGAQQAMAGNQAAGGDLSGTYPNPALGTSGVTAGTYGDGAHIPVITLDAKGRATAATTAAISGGYVLPDASTSAIGGVEVVQSPHTGHPTAVIYASAPSGDTTGATDTTNLQADLNAITTSGGTLILRPGAYYITSLSLNAPTRIIGAGCGDDSFAHFATRIICVSGTANAITVTSGAPGSSFESFALTNGATSTPTAGAGFLFGVSGSSVSMRMRDVLVRGFYTNIDIQYGAGWVMDGVHSFDAVHYSLHIANGDNADSGDSGIVNSLFFSGPTNTTPAALIRYESSGGLRCVGSKFNNYNTGSATVAFDLAVADGAATSNFVFEGNSVENFGSYGLHVHLAGPSNTGTWRNIIIVGNEFKPVTTGSGTAVSITPEASGKINDVVAIGNVISGTSVGYGLSNVNNVLLGATVYDNVTTLVSQGSGVTNLSQLSTNATATTSTLGIVEVDNNSGGTPIAITEAGYLTSITGLTTSNLAAAAGILLSQIGQSGASPGQVPQFNGTAWAPTTLTTGGGGGANELLTTDGTTNPPESLWTEDGTDWIYADAYV